MGSFSHILAGFSLGFHHRRELRQLLDNTPARSTILELDPEALHSSGIAALALDFDGVLAGHGAPVPLPEAVAWMKRCEAVFGGDRIFILSNKPTDGRRRWFAEHFPAMRFISGVRKKPYPDGLNRTGELAGVPLSSILMVDDRLLTGCLAALVAGARPCYIRRPYASFSYRPAAELFFWLLRSGERLFVRLITPFNAIT
ncbi:MAG: HAD family hydrolase [Desulfuromonadaceae bacterium]